jgi:hypothetical protein
MTPWWITALVGIALVIVAAWLAAKLSRRNMLLSNRDSLILKERAAIYVVLAAQGARYLSDVPVSLDLLTDADLETRLNLYASTAVRGRWADFRAVMEPLGSGKILGRIVQDASTAAPGTSPGEINQRQQEENDRLRQMAVDRYKLLMESIRAELSS